MNPGAESVLPLSQKLCYGLGHALNDLTASMWFSYILVYLQLVLEFDPTYAGVILLIGQVGDAVVTPLLGIEASSSCKDNSGICRRYGRRKTMHLVGTFCVLISFPFIFSSCPGCERASVLAKSILLIPIVLIFQFGWAATQISHLSLIPILTPYEHERDCLTVIRYAVDILSDISTYLIVWAVFDLTSETQPPKGRIVTPAYKNKFLIIVLAIEVVGALLSLSFHVGVQEVKRTAPKRHRSGLSFSEGGVSRTSAGQEERSRELKWHEWLKQINLYQIGLLYMLTRLFTNMCSVFAPLYLQEYLGANDDMMAKFPLVMNITGFVASFLVPKMFRLLGKKVTCLLGAAMGIGACVWVAYGEGYPYCAKGVYGVAMVLGVSSSLLMVSGLSFVHDLIGTSTESGPFVYGYMSFWDKMANGIAGMSIQRLHAGYCNPCNWFYRDVLAYGVGGVAALSVILLLTLLPQNLTKNSVTRQQDDRSQDPLLKDTSDVTYGSLLVDERLILESSDAQLYESLVSKNTSATVY